MKLVKRAIGVLTSSVQTLHLLTCHISITYSFLLCHEQPSNCPTSLLDPFPPTMGHQKNIKMSDDLGGQGRGNIVSKESPHDIPTYSYLVQSTRSNLPTYL